MYFIPAKKSSGSKPVGATSGSASGASSSPAKKKKPKEESSKPAKESAAPGSQETTAAAGEAGGAATPNASEESTSAEQTTAPDATFAPEEEATTEEAAAEPETPPEPETNERWRFYRDAVEKLYPGSFSDWQLEFNVVGVLGYLDGEVVPNEPGVFNDTLALAWKDEAGNERCLEVKATCDAGGRDNERREVHLWPGQYRFEKAKVRDTSGEYEAFQPKGPVTVFFDSNGDGRFHPDDETKTGSFPQIFLGAASGAANEQFAGGQLVAGGRGAGSAWEEVFTELSKAKGPFLYVLTDGDTLLDPIGDPEEGSAKEEAPAPVTGVPSGPNPNDPAANPPKLLGDVPMAPSTGLFWPVVPKKGKPNKLVFYAGEKKKNGWGGRHFGAPREGGSRTHAGIDLIGKLGDTVVACEAGVIVNWYHFYRGVYALIVQNDSGTVINYGEVDERSKKAYGWKIGDRVEAGQPIAYIGKMYKDSMLHFEMFVQGTKHNKRWKTKPDPALLNPTQYLLDVAAFTAG